MFEEKLGLLNKLRDCCVHDLRSPMHLFVSSKHSRSIVSLAVFEPPKHQGVAKLRVALWDRLGQDDEEVRNMELSFFSREWKIFLLFIFVVVVLLLTDLLLVLTITFRLAYILSRLGLVFFEIIVFIFACLLFGFSVLVLSLGILLFVSVTDLEDTTSSNTTMVS